MAILNILHFPDPRLRNRAVPVERVDDEVRRLVDDLLETMYDAPGVGLAATQVNVQRRVVVIDVSEERDSPLCLINPEILHHEGAVEMEEGCLSVPGVYDTVQRAERIRLRALDRDAQPYELDADGLLAVCVQHELDHLNGKLFIDYLSQLKRQRITKKAKTGKLQRQAL
jgi:peptide deformylase